MRGVEAWGEEREREREKKEGKKKERNRGGERIVRSKSKKWNEGEGGCMSDGGEVKRKEGGYVGGGEKKWKKEEEGDI